MEGDAATSNLDEDVDTHLSEEATSILDVATLIVDATIPSTLIDHRFVTTAVNLNTSRETVR